MAEKKRITKGMTLGEIITEYPEAVEIMLKNGLHCVGCHVAAYETLEQGAKAHGMSDKQIEVMLNEMNELVKNIKEKSKKLKTSYQYWKNRFFLKNIFKRRLKENSIFFPRRE